MRKKDINIFGNDSVAYVHQLGNNPDGYAVVRKCDNAILASGHQFKRYRGDIIYTMYTGGKYATGDYILESDRHGCIYKFS